jgi:hypothetical protein
MVPRRRDILDRFVAELEILLEGDGVLDAREDDGGGDDQRAGDKAPLLKVRKLVPGAS